MLSFVSQNVQRRGNLHSVGRDNVASSYYKSSFRIGCSFWGILFAHAFRHSQCRATKLFYYVNIVYIRTHKCDDKLSGMSVAINSRVLLNRYPKKIHLAHVSLQIDFYHVHPLLRSTFSSSQPYSVRGVWLWWPFSCVFACDGMTFYLVSQIVLALLCATPYPWGWPMPNSQLCEEGLKPRLGGPSLCWEIVPELGMSG